MGRERLSHLKLSIGIGITTYHDITAPAFGAAVFDAYAAISAAITPNRVHARSMKYVVKTRDDFAQVWLTRIPFAIRANRRRGSEVLEHGEHLVGAEWRHVGSPTGQGQVVFRPETQTEADNTVLISHHYSPGIEWNLLFFRLVEILSPSYAMLHLFSEKDEATISEPERFEHFDGPIAGERWFTSWKANTGAWRYPDSFDLKGRRTYRFLPELAWANFFGPEFDGQYDQDSLRAVATHSAKTPIGLVLNVTDNLHDVVADRERFIAARRRVKAVFPPGFFRNP